MQRSMAGGMGGGDLVETAMKAGNFNTLAKALEAAGLVETLKSGTYTVFAPTDEAFAKLPAGTLDDLLKPENRERLRSILTYHVVPGKLAAADLAKIDNVSTAQGTDMILMIKAKGTAVTINNATVTQPDVAASNGVVHAIDTVLMPKPMKGMSKSKNKATTGDKKMEGQTTTEGGTPQSGSSPSTSPQSGSTPSSTSPSSSTPSSPRPNSSSPNNTPSSTTQTP
ncbi:MAG: fasciclin domain-containing protein [Pyrinomonadaceae bacterium]|nr:fasciclin domain-containing protein [Pyrinomonadaceae bacterium]